MNLAEARKDMYEQFEPKQDALFFKVGRPGMISFHGKNYNIKKRMTPDESNKLIKDVTFVKIATDVYVNVGKVTSIKNDCLCFDGNGDKQVPVSKQNLQVIKKLLS